MNTSRSRLEQGKHVIIESRSRVFRPGTRASRATFPERNDAVRSARQLRPHPRRRQGKRRRVCYAENWIYAPAVQKSARSWPKVAARSCGCWANSPQRIPFSVLRLLAIQRWRILGAGLPPAEHGAVSEAGGRQTRNGLRFARHGQCANPRVTGYPRIVMRGSCAQRMKMLKTTPSSTPNSPTGGCRHFSSELVVGAFTTGWSCM